MADDSDDDHDAEPPDLSRPDRGEFGSYLAERRAVQDAAAKTVAAIAQQRVHQFIPEENVRKFMHGRAWSSPAAPDDVRDEMVTIQHVSTLRWDDITDHNLGIVSKSIREIGAGMADKQIQNMFQSVSNVCDRTGNVVDAKERSFAEAFIEMLEKIEFGVGADGEVSVPSIYVAPEMGDRILKELEGQPPEYQARAEALVEEKKAAALANERARFDRFRRGEE